MTTINSKQLSSLNLLYTDTKKYTLNLFEKKFKNQFKNIFFSNTVEKALEIFITNQPDIVVVDSSISDRYGIEIIEQIRIMNKQVPIILVTNFFQKEVVVSALKIGVNNFFEKPVDLNILVETIKDHAKLINIDKFVKEQKDQEIKELKKIEKYKSYQENIAFQKELKIMKNDFDPFVREFNEQAIFVNTYYKPLNTLSGDAYTVRDIGHGQIFILIADGMGKGLSASLSAMNAVMFANYLIDAKKIFNLKKIVENTITYISAILLEEEALCLNFTHLNIIDNKMEYAKFSMPATLLIDNSGDIIKVPSNNPPLSIYTKDFKIDSYDVSSTLKFLFYSDGVIENTTKNGGVYQDQLLKDFQESFTEHELHDKFTESIFQQEDDVTFVMLNRLNLSKKTLDRKIFNTTTEDVQTAGEWFENILIKKNFSEELLNRYSIAFNELYMNAYEHGNLSINTKEKHKLIAEGTYMDQLNKLSIGNDKKIEVTIREIKYLNHHYIYTTITDEGNGFDTDILKDVYKGTKRYNGRGVYMSKRNTLGVYYSKKANSVSFLIKIV